MPVFNTTPSRGYQLPHASNRLSEDIPRLIAAFNAIDVDVATLLNSLSSKVSAASPAFTGSPTAPTPTAGDSSGRLATTAFVQLALAALVDSAPGALNTLNELAAALADDPSFAATVTADLASKTPRVSPSVDNAVPRFNGTDGTLQGSNVAIGDDGAVSTPGGVTINAPHAANMSRSFGVASTYLGQLYGMRVAYELDATGTPSRQMRAIHNGLEKTAIILNNEGDISLPSQPVFACLNGNSNHQTSGLVNWTTNLIEYQHSPGYFNGTVYVIPSTGVYRLDAILFANLPQAWSIAAFYFHVNGFDVGLYAHSSVSHASPLTYQTIPLSSIRWLSAGDVVGVRIAVLTNGATLHPGSHSYLSIVKIA